MVEPTGVKRKLAVGADEGATLKTLSAYCEIIDGLIARHANEPRCSEGQHERSTQQA